MSNYEHLGDDPKSRNLDNELGPLDMSVLKKVRSGSCFLIFSSFVIPPVTYFSGPSFYAFIVGCILCIWQIVIGFMGARSIYGSRYRKILRFRLNVTIYFIVLIFLLLAYEISIISYQIKDNYDNCNHVELNRVCEKRWGILTWKMILFMILPTVDILVVILLIYYRKLTKACTTDLIQRSI